MALIRFPEGQQRSGSTGGVVFSHNRYGAYTRARSIPVNPQTERQDAVRTNLKNLTIRWYTTLTDGQRAGWNQYAANVPWVNGLGDSCNLTGLNMYLRTNAVALQLGASIIDDAPVIQNLAEAPYVFTCTGSEATGLISVAFDNTEPWAGEVGGYLAVWQGIPTNPTRNFFNGPWRYVGNVPGAVVPPASPVTMGQAFLMLETQKVVCYCRVLRTDGRLSVATRDDFLCAA